MALVKCPACGNMVSENADLCPNCGEPIASKYSNQVDSGTVSFSVTENNRIKLTKRTQEEIRAKTAQLSTEGKTVVNVNISAPQPFSLGFTVWSNDVTIIWNANLNSEKYKEFLYSQGKQYYHSGHHVEALEIFEKIKGYADSESLAGQCEERINAMERKKKEVAEQAAQHAKQMRNAIGDDPSKTSIGALRSVIGWLLIGVGFMCVVGGGCSADSISDPANRDTFILGLVLLVIGAVCIIWNRILHKKYEEKAREYIPESEKFK